MACGSSCYGKPASTPLEQSNLTPASMEEERDSCCDDVTLMADKDPDQPGISSAARDELAEEDNYCAPKPATPTCKKDCCSVPNSPCPDPSPVSSCCKGKTASCCDQSCLDRIALRECKNDEPGRESYSSTASNCGRGKDGKPCIDHANKTHVTYAERLAALGCICRALTTLGQESCCLPSHRPSTGSVRRRLKEILSYSRASTES